MSADNELQHIWSLNAAGLSVCAGYLNCIFKRLQMERPLTEDEIRHAHEEAEALVMDEYDSLHKHVFEKEQS